MKIRIKNVIILTIIFLFFGAALTNPKKDAYVGWCKEELASSENGTIEKSLVSLIGGPIVQNSTKTHNYIFFSIYETTIESDKAKVLGIFNNFIPVSKSKVDANKKGV